MSDAVDDATPGEVSDGEGGGDDRSGSPRQPYRRYLICIAVAYVLVRLLGPAWRTGFPEAFPDSSSYRAAAVAGPFSWDFWFGQRPPTYPLLIWLVGPSARAVIVAQTLIAVLAWGWLLSTLVTSLRSRWVAAVAGTMLVLIAVQTRWIFWHTALLTESLSSSLAVAGIAAWWRWWQHPTTFRTSAATALTVAWMLLRDSNAVTLLVVAAPAFVAVLVAEHRASTDRRRGLAIALTGIIVAGGFSVTAQMVSNRGETSLHNNVALRYLTDPEMSGWMEARGMPVGPALLERAGADAWADGEAMLRSPELAEYRDWADGRGKVAVAASFVVKADWYLARAHREAEIYTGTDHLAYDTFAVAEQFPERPLWRIDPVDSRASVYLWVALVVAATGLLLVRRRRWGWFAVFLLVPVLIDGYLGFAADAVEVGRHLVGPMLRFSVSAVVIVALAADVALAERATTDATPPEARGDD